MTTEFGQPGQIIDGKYRIVRLLGTGGMGAVYEGENVRIRRKVAIKMLHPSVSSQADVVTRFEREAQAAGTIGSEHICEVLDMGELPDHTRYMVMEYLDGETLSSRIKRSGRLPPALSIPLLVQILDALGAAHAAGIVHRDLKPDNIFILPQRGGTRDFIKILDFGVSKFSQLSGEAMNVTRAGAVVGTPYYMSPEQARGGTVDQRTDIYAIGVLLYQATTGQVPYQAETFNELLFKIVLETAPPPQTYVPDLDPEFAAIIQRAMAREFEQRFQSCAEFRDALLAFQARLNTTPAVPHRPSGPMPLGTQILDANAVNQQLAHGGYDPARASGIGMQPLDPSRMSSPSGAAPGWGNVSGAGTAGAAQMGMSSPGTAGAPGAQAWANASAAGVNAGIGAPPTATANSWGNTSGTGTPPKPASKMPLVIGLVATVAVLGGGTAAAIMFLGKKGPDRPPATGASVAVSATPTAPAASTPAHTATAAPTEAPTSTTAATPSATPSSAPSSTPTAKPLSSSVPKAPGTGTPKSPGNKTPPRESTGTKTPPRGKRPGGDLGY